MTILIVLASVALILDCLLLGLLILVQLPKKEAGVGMAFGGGAADALFGAGSGTALSNLTKWTAGLFFVLVFCLSILNNHSHQGSATDLKRQLERQSALPSTPTPSPAPAAPAPSTATPQIPLTISSNTAVTPAPAAPATNKP